MWMLGQSYLNAEMMLFGCRTPHPHRRMQPEQHRTRTVQPSFVKKRNVHICGFVLILTLSAIYVSVLVCQLSKWHCGPKMKPSERGETSASAHFLRCFAATHMRSCISETVNRCISFALKRYLSEQAGCFSISSSIQSVSTAHAPWLRSADACWLVGTIHSASILLSAAVNLRSMKVLKWVLSGRDSKTLNITFGKHGLILKWVKLVF